MPNTIAPMTLREIEATLNHAVPSLLSEHEDRLNLAETEFTNKTRRELFLSDAAHKATVADSQGQLDTARTKTAEVTQTLEERLLAVNKTLETPLPPRLSDDELANANSRAPFVKEDVQSLPLDKLTERVRIAVALEDRVEQYLFLRYYRQDVYQHKPGDDTDQLDRLMQDIQNRLADSRFKPLQAKAKDLRSRLSKLQSRAVPSQTLANLQRSERYGF